MNYFFQGRFNFFLSARLRAESNRRPDFCKCLNVPYRLTFLNRWTLPIGSLRKGETAKNFLLLFALYHLSLRNASGKVSMDLSKSPCFANIFG